MENSRVDLKNGNEFLASLTKIHHSFQWISKTFITAKKCLKDSTPDLFIHYMRATLWFSSKVIVIQLGLRSYFIFHCIYIIKLRQNAVLSSYLSVLRAPPSSSLQIEDMKLSLWSLLPHLLKFVLQETFFKRNFSTIQLLRARLKLLSVPAFNFSTWFIYFIICVTSTRHRYFLFLDPELYIYMSWNIKKTFALW